MNDTNLSVVEFESPHVYTMKSYPVVAYHCALPAPLRCFVVETVSSEGHSVEIDENFGMSDSWDELPYWEREEIQREILRQFSERQA